MTGIASRAALLACLAPLLAGAATAQTAAGRSDSVRGTSSVTAQAACERLSGKMVGDVKLTTMLSGWSHSCEAW